MILSLLLILSLAGCAQGAPAATQAPEFTWSRQGTFSNADNDFLSVAPSEDAENPGWYVLFMTAGDMYGWYIPQEGKTLHGNLVSPYMEGEPFVVTVSEEGEDGLLLKTEAGKEYHFIPYEVPQAAFTVNIRTAGFGQIAYAEGAGTPEFDDEFPAQSAYIGLEAPATYTFAAKPNEGYKFIRWTKNGRDYVSEPQISIEITEDTELVAVFGPAGSSEEHVELDSVTALGELLGLPNYGTAAYEDRYIYAFEQDGDIYRAVAKMPAEVSRAVFELDFDDADYTEKLSELISPLPVDRIDNLSAGLPTQEELDALVGKSGEELLNDGWHCWSWNYDSMEFSMDHGVYSYNVVFEGAADKSADFTEEALKPLTVKSVTCTGVGDPTALED